MERWPLLLVVILLLIWGGRCSAASVEPRTSQAYVTLLYGDEFLLGVRVLGKSLRDTGTTKDLVVLVSDGVSAEAINLLQADGWIVERIQLVENPNQQRPKRFWGVYTKLKVFNMTQYKKIVYLDADTIVVKNIDDLFGCQKFCANLKHSERLNSGVMVVEPSRELFEDMSAKIASLYSYTGGDQGFLNSYYPDFPNAQLFDPDLPAEQRKPKAMERLSTLYNADVGLYMLANKWMVDASELRVVHYTLGPLKPWDWWTEWLLKPVDLWQNIRRTLQSSLPGTAAGLSPRLRLLVLLLSVIPIVSSALLIWLRFRDSSQSFRACDGHYFKHMLFTSGLPIYSGVKNSGYQQANGKVPAYLGAVSIVVCFVLAMGSIGISFLLIPRQIMPWTGMLLLYEWTLFLFFLSFGKYLDLVYSMGKRSGGAVSAYNDPKGHSRLATSIDGETAVYGFGMTILLVFIPCFPFMLNVTALFMRLGLIVAASMVLVAFMTYAAEHLSIRWYIKGREAVVQH